MRLIVERQDGPFTCGVAVSRRLVVPWTVIIRPDGSALIDMKANGHLAALKAALEAYAEQPH